MQKWRLHNNKQQRTQNEFIEFKMPSRVRFQTEYNSSFKGPKGDISKIARSPILKPRPNATVKLPDVEGEEDRRGREAGLRSFEAHVTQEPPLQYRKIVQHDKNHNIKKTTTTEQDVIVDRGSLQAEEVRNPILDYASDISRAKKGSKGSKESTKVGSDVQMKSANETLKVAGKESDNLRYLVLEPPMQRRRISPYKLNHNILKTDTINYINGSDNGSDETSDRMPSPPANGEANGEKEMDQTKRRLEYEGSPVKRAAGKRSEDSLVQLRRDEDVTPKRVMKENKEPQPSAKRFSPAKEQRKKDLIGMKNKQNERVDRALRIKAGLQTIEPPLHSHPIKSEYQRQFAWKEPMKTEPPKVLKSTVEDKNVSTNIDDYEKKKKKNKARPFKSEYQLQFREYPLVRPSSDVNAVAPDEAVELKHSSNGNVAKPPDKRLIQPSKNIQALFFPHGSQSSLTTEYIANFKSPVAAKKGEVAPHLQPREVQEPVLAEEFDWFKEVLRLREKAEQYKIRSRETHYPTVFYASLEDDESDTSHGPSRKSSTDSKSGQAENGQNEEKAKAKSTQVTNGKDVATVSEEPREEVQENHQVNQDKEPAVASNKTEIDNEAHVSDATEEAEIVTRIHRQVSSSSSDDSESVMDLMKGRIDSARLKNNYDHRRHNLDRTTPLRKGTVAQPSQKLSSEVTAPVHEFRSLGPDMGLRRYKPAWAPDPQRSAVGKSEKTRSLQDFGHSNVVRETRAAPAVLQRAYRRDKYEDKNGDLVLSDLEEPRGEIDRKRVTIDAPDTNDYEAELSRKKTVILNRTSRPPKSFVQPSEIGEKFAREKEAVRFGDFDALSDTSMSARDSVISDVLERSRNRRDNFW